MGVFFCFLFRHRCKCAGEYAIKDHNRFIHAKGRGIFQLVDVARDDMCKNEFPNQLSRIVCQLV